MQEADPTFSPASSWFKKLFMNGRRFVSLQMRALAATPFVLGKAQTRNVFLAYQPDAYARFNRYEDFNTLSQQFSRHNRRINAGDSARLWSFILNLDQILAEGIRGDFAELGVWKGNTAAILAHFAAKGGREVFLFDTFQGFDKSDFQGPDAHRSVEFEDTSMEVVRDVIGPHTSVCHFVKGHFPGSVNDGHKSRTYAVVSLDCDLYEPMKAGLEFFYPRMSRGGIFLLHDYASGWWPGVRQAVDEFCKASGEFVVLMPDRSGSAFIRKSR